MVLAQTVMVDLSQNYYKNQLFGMGKFNVFPRSNFIFMKYYLMDDFQNVYMHENLPAVQTLNVQLSNQTVN